MGDPKTLRRYRANLRGEVDGAAVYAALARAEADPKLADVYRRLGGVERAPGEFWRKQIRAAGGNPEKLKPSMRAQLFAWLAGRFSPAFVLPAITAGEARDSGAYDSQPEAVSAGLPADERSHARLMEAVAGSAGGLSGPALRQLGIGLAAAGIIYGAGALVGGAVG